MKHTGSASPADPWSRLGVRPGGPARRKLRLDARGRRGRADSTPPAPTDNPQVFTSTDQRLRFQVQAIDGDLVVHRWEHIDGQGLREECLLIPTRSTFDQWIADDPVRFSDPVTFDALRRCGHAGLGS